MKFQPISADEANKASNKFALWPRGTYDCEIVEASDEISKNGNEMIKLRVKVFSQDGGDSRTVFDYLLEAIPYKVRHAAEAFGLVAEYDNGTLSGFDFQGRTGQCILFIQKDKTGQFGDKNAVADYVPAKASAAPSAHRIAPPQMGGSTGASLDDEIPFAPSWQ